MSKRISPRRLAMSVANALYGTARPQASSLAVLLALAGLNAAPAMAADEVAKDDAPAAETAAEPQATSLDNVIVTGTRKVGMAVTDSPAPIQMVSAETLKQTAAPDLMNAIANQVPSYNANQTGGDMASQTLTASLRSLSPNHTLVLVNGKRRHVTSNVGAESGAAAADLSFIPTSAIDHVEVLTDGAAALYGSDAIAGVINIILKNNYEGGSFDAGYAGYGDGGGGTDSWGANIGFGGPDAWLSLSAEVENRKSVYRFSTPSYAHCLEDIPACQAYADANGRSSLQGYIDNDQGALMNPRFPYLNSWLNPPEVHRKVLFFNAGATLGNGLELYAFGSFGKKTAVSEENYRRPSQDGGYVNPFTGEVTHKYAAGFHPKEASDEVDYSWTAGVTGDLAGWLWDFSTTYGKDRMEVYTRDSMNFTLWNETGASPEDFYDGAYWATQWTTGLNATKNFEVGLSTPLTFSAGIEHRVDQYGIQPGDPASYYGVGASSFPGYNPAVNTGSYDRNSIAAFANVIFNPTENWLVDLAVRYEDYTDFGNKTVGKLTTRYDFTDSFAVRATASTGFRAPTLGEGFYSAVNVSPTGAFPQLQPNSAAAAALGFGSGLQPETSKNYSLGFVFQPLTNLTSTLDFYRIDIDDRISRGEFAYSTSQSPATRSGQNGGAYDPLLPDPADTNGDGTPDAEYNQALGEALVGLGYIGQWDDPTAPGGALDPTARANISVVIFNNSLKTRTQGVDWVTNYLSDFGWGSINWSLAANYNKTEVLSTKPAPAVLGGATMYSPSSLYLIEKGNPKYRINLGATVNVGNFSLTVRESIYGPQLADLGNPDAYPADVQERLDLVNIGGATFFKQEIGTLALTDVELSYRPNDAWTISVGGDNVFNKYPDKLPRAAWDYDVANYNNGNNQYLAGSPIGYFGARWFAKVSYKF